MTLIPSLEQVWNLPSITPINISLLKRGGGCALLEDLELLYLVVFLLMNKQIRTEVF